VESPEAITGLFLLITTARALASRMQQVLDDGDAGRNFAESRVAGGESRGDGPLLVPPSDRLGLRKPRYQRNTCASQNQNCQHGSRQLRGSVSPPARFAESALGLLALLFCKRGRRASIG
jgi:hypothetical protein